MERLARADEGEGLNAIIERGKRAMTIETDAQSSLGGFLAPGNQVDVIVTIRPDDKNIGAKWLTDTILQDVKVLAVGDSLRARPTGDDGSKKKGKKRGRNRPSVTLELSPSEAEKLALASSKGDLHLVLRSEVDTYVYDDDGELTNTDQMLGVAKMKPKEAPKRKTTSSSQTLPMNPPGLPSAGSRPWRLSSGPSLAPEPEP